MVLYQTFYSFKEEREYIFMDNFEELFDRETVEHISSLVEDKMYVLKDVKDFKEKEKKLSQFMEEMDQALPEELKEKFDDVVRLTYQVEEYYFTLAYMLGSKYDRKLGKI